MQRYNPNEIEAKWQAWWDEQQTYRADLTSDKPKYFAFSMFNYPSGAGIHIGHAMNYTISDVKARYKRQAGYESYHPIGWDAFGLPAENYAIKSGVSPQASMAKIIPSYHSQYKAMGWSNDWSREIATHTPEYYKWTQWIFSQMYQKGLAYQDARLQWWCEKDNTVVANEQLVDGKCWRHDGPDDPVLEQKEVKQWFFKITDYADELLDAIDDLDWTESVKLAQKNWIGRSIGAEVSFMPAHQSKYVVLHGFEGKPDSNWFEWFTKSLEASGNSVTVPALPNPGKPSAEEQAASVLATNDFDETSVLVGHSYGAVTALKIVEQLDQPIQRLVLAAGFAEPGFLDGWTANFEATTNWDFNFEKIRQNVKEIVILRDLSDSIVPPERADYLQRMLGGSIVDFTANDSHICGTQEPVVLEAAAGAIKVFTTRPDTIFGASFLVIAPEHPLVGTLTTNDQRAAVDEYVANAKKLTEVERQAAKEKTGVFSGSYAINPASGEKVPIWIADYVLLGYGTGAIMAVPAHDERDAAFAEKFDLPLVPVIVPSFRNHSETATDRPTIVVVGKDAESGKFCVLNWPEGSAKPSGKITDGIQFPGGGIDDGETLEQAALREFTEETGYTDITVEKILPAATATYYENWAGVPSDKRVVRNVAIVTVNSQNNTGVQGTEDYEKDAYTVEWLTEKEIMASMKNEWLQLAQFAFGSPVYTEKEGVMINSGKYSNLLAQDAREQIVADLAVQGLATEKVNYKMRDWSVSRQRYWGAPIPIIHCEKCGPQLVADDKLPVVLPELDDFQPSGDGRSALARADDWLNVECPNCQGPAERETDTLDTYICSSWYMLRYLDPTKTEQIFNSDIVNKWMPVDFYNGGDHATAHLLYARFVTRFFTKIGLMDNPEPFKQMLFNGKVMASDGSAFSKSKGNGVDPLEIINSGYGADALRTYLMFAAPLEFSARWDPQGVPGTYRFLNRLWTLCQEYAEAGEGELSATVEADISRVTHGMIKKVSLDLEENRYNTAISATMSAVNDLFKLKVDNLVKHVVWQEAVEALVCCVAPFAPHIAEELWHQLGHDDSVHVDHWPVFNEAYLQTDTVTIIVQVNGKLRADIQVAADADEANVVTAAQSHEKVAPHLEGKDIKKTIFISGKLVNFVAI